MAELNDLLERRAEKQQEKPDRSAGQRLFIAQQAEIETAIEAGWTLTEIYQTLDEADKMPVGYRAFTNYVDKFITNKKKKRKVRSEKDAESPGLVDDSSQPSGVSGRNKNKMPLVGAADQSKKIFDHDPTPDESLFEE